MRVAARDRRVQPDELQQFGDPRGPLAPAGPELVHLAAARRPSAPTVAPRVERGERILEHHAGPRGAASAAAGGRSAVTSMPSKTTVPRGGLDQPQQGVAQRRLARTRDSPTSPRVSPRRMSRSTPSTARSTPAAAGPSRRPHREVHLQVRGAPTRTSLTRRPPRTTSPRGAAARPGAAGADHGQRRLLGLAARVGPHRAARPERAPGGQARSARVARPAPSRARGRRRRRGRGEVGQRAQQAPRVGVRRVARGRRRTGAVLHAPAAVHDQHPVGDPGDHAEVVGDPDDAGAALGLQPLDQVEDLRLHGDVERRRRLVGDQQRRASCTARSRSSPAARMPPESSCGNRSSVRRRDRPAPPRRAGPRPGAGRRAIGTSPCARMPSTICRPTLSTGLSEVIGSWKTMPAPGPRTCRSRSGDIVQQVLALQQRRAGHRRDPRGQQPQQRQHRHALAAARLPDDGDRLARADPVADAR